MSILQNICALLSLKLVKTNSVAGIHAISGVVNRFKCLLSLIKRTFPGELAFLMKNDGIENLVFALYPLSNIKKKKLWL